VTDHSSINNFKRENPKAISYVFRAPVKLIKYYDLIGGQLVSGDNTKQRAKDSKKINFIEAKFERHIEYSDSKLKEYNNAFSSLIPIFQITSTTCFSH
jgi:hypothetical protein